MPIGRQHAQENARRGADGEQGKREPLPLSDFGRALVHASPVDENDDEQGIDGQTDDALPRRRVTYVERKVDKG